MQSRFMSFVESIAQTLATGISAAAANYYVLPMLWDLHPSFAGSLQMSVFFGVLSIVVKYPLRRGFNAIRR